MSLKNPSGNSSSRPPDPHDRKRPVSERKIQANRENSLKSTGPKTERGKRLASLNAITHGILAREVVIGAGDGEESQEEFQALTASLWQYYEPFGPIEGMLVEEIAVTWWRKARLIRTENGEIRKRQDTLSMDLLLRNSDKINLALLQSQPEMYLFNSKNPADAKVGTVERQSVLQSVDRSLREHSSGLTHLSAILGLAKAELASDGQISEPVRKNIFRLFYSTDLPFATLCRNADYLEAPMEGRTPERNIEKDLLTDRAFITGVIDQKLKELDLLKKFSIERAKLALDAEDRSSSLPSGDAIDKIVRYEAHLDRKLYRAMDQLERLQRQRKGENVPPPLNINLGPRT